MRRHTEPPLSREKVLQNDAKNKLIRKNPFAWAHAPGHVLLTMYSTTKDIIHFTEMTQWNSWRTSVCSWVDVSSTFAITDHFFQKVKFHDVNFKIMVMVSCLKQGSEMCNFRRVVLTRGVAAYTPLCTPVPRMWKLNKKQKQNRETKKKSKRYIRDSKVNTGVANGSVPQNICSSGFTGLEIWKK